MIKTMIQTVLVALVVGGLSAGGSFYWHQLNQKKAVPEAVAETEKKEADPDADEKKPEDQESTEMADSHESAPVATETIEQSKAPVDTNPEPFSFGPPVAARPPYTPSADDAGDLIRKLRVRLASSTRQERRVAEREDAMKLIVDDLRDEQTKAAKLKKQLADEQALTLKTLEQARKAVNLERETLYEDVAVATRQNEERMQGVMREKEEAVKKVEESLKAAQDEQDELRRQLDEVRQPAKVKDISGSPELSTNLKKTAETMDSMPPETTAKLLKETVKEGRTEAAVVMLNSMKPRVCAKVIDAIAESDPELAAELIERLKRFKKPGSAPTPPPAAPAPGL